MPTTTEQLQALKDKHQELTRKHAAGEGQLTRLREDLRAAEEELKAQGVDTPEDAENEITRLDGEAVAATEEAQRLLDEAEHILSGGSPAAVVEEGDTDL